MTSTKDLLKKKKDLVEEQDKLIQIIKTKYQDVYEWFEKHDISLRSLAKYTKQIGIIFVLSLSLMTSVVPTSTKEVTNDQYKITLSSDKLRTLSPDENRALKVWNANRKEIAETSQKYNIDPRIIFATIMVESMGNTHAIRYEPHLNDSSYGLGQILYTTAQYIGYNGAPEGLYDPSTNIELIGRYYKRSIDVYGNLSPAQMATTYNAGNPYGVPTYGHVQRFERWYTILDRFVNS